VIQLDKSTRTSTGGVAESDVQVQTVDLRPEIQQAQMVPSVDRQPVTFCMCVATVITRQACRGSVGAMLGKNFG